MGLTHNSIRFVLYARSRGASFRRTATIGRQRLLIEPDVLAELLRAYGYDIGLETAATWEAEHAGFAEPLFRLLGADQLCSFDASAYERATNVHDFNEPLPESYDRHFDVVVECGSLEHIFDVRTALSNCMNLVDVHGHFIAISPANNFFGHGFYQFSPEFFHRAFSEENGFAIELLAVYEDVGQPRWYEVPDPRSLQRRLVFTNSRPTYLALLARRISALRPLAAVPQESDYAELWEDPALSIAARTNESAPGPSAAPGHLKQRAEVPLRRLLMFQDELRSRRRMTRLGLRSLDIP